MVTNRPGLALGVSHADCGPALFADPTARVIGAAHAGWKGALAGVLEATVARMEEFGARRERIVVCLGPTIGPRNYEVGPEFKGVSSARAQAAPPSFGTRMIASSSTCPPSSCRAFGRRE
jgi:copper oxidase (laccase) domain-containing protein